MTCTLTRALARPETNWYTGRAAAESAKTLGWRYAVGGAPFPLDEAQATIDDRFLKRLREVVEQLKDTALTAPDSTAHELTAAMRNLRRQDIATRRLAYKRDRITDQLSWYERRTKTHAASATRWISFVVASSALGVLAAALKFLVIDVDLLGVFAARSSNPRSGERDGERPNTEERPMRRWGTAADLRDAALGQPERPSNLGVVAPEPVTSLLDHGPPDSGKLDGSLLVGGKKLGGTAPAGHRVRLPS